MNKNIVLCLSTLLFAGCATKFQNKDTIIVDYLNNRAHWEVTENPTMVSHCIKLYGNDKLLCSKFPIEDFIKAKEKELNL